MALPWLGACSDYVPPVAGDSTSKAYLDDLAACQKSGNAEAHRRVMAKFDLWIVYPFSLPYQQRERITDCMSDKGHHV